MYHTCKLRVCEVSLLYLLLYEFADIYVLEVCIHRCTALLLSLWAIGPLYGIYTIKNVGTYIVHQKRGIAKHHKANESNINPHAGGITIHAFILLCTMYTTNASIILTHPALRSFWRFPFLDEAYNALIYRPL